MFSLVPLTDKVGQILAEIHEACFPDAWSVETFDTLLKDKTTCGWLGKDDEGKVVGFILARALHEEAEILTFAVHPSFHQKGLGRLLLQELLNFLRSVHCIKIFLEVAMDNEHAISLYKAFGFGQIATRPNYYRQKNGQFINAFVMTRDLY